MFRIAYPKKSPSHSKVLIDRLIFLFPSEARGIFTAHMVNARANRRKVKWEGIKKLAGACAESEIAELVGSQEVIINIGNEQLGSSNRRSDVGKQQT